MPFVARINYYLIYCSLRVWRLRRPRTDGWTCMIQNRNGGRVLFLSAVLGIIITLVRKQFWREFRILERTDICLGYECSKEYDMEIQNISIKHNLVFLIRVRVTFNVRQYNLASFMGGDDLHFYAFPKTHIRYVLTQITYLSFMIYYSYDNSNLQYVYIH